MQAKFASVEAALVLSLEALEHMWGSQEGSLATAAMPTHSYLPLLAPARLSSVRMAEWSKAPRSGRGPLLRAWVRIPLLT